MQSQMKNSKARECATDERKQENQEECCTWKTAGEGGSAWLEKVDLTSGERGESGSDRSGLRRESLSRNSYKFAVVKHVVRHHHAKTNPSNCQSLHTATGCCLHALKQNVLLLSKINVGRCEKEQGFGAAVGCSRECQCSQRSRLVVCQRAANGSRARLDCLCGARSRRAARRLHSTLLQEL